ncbi:unnamed protein product [Paramecium sonneborni]|uniref:ACB domain-containing protein n=1 Tax=Paramecium sonneborni TaxID=65129 RepID=A0A8S1KMN0_9CILI|nr:unnamed protein product [Paramecium sonneborni]
MSTVQERFDLIQKFIKSPGTGGKELDNSQKLQLYALFKQISEGPCKGSAPSKLKVVERAKYDAWKKLGNISKEKAQEQYIKVIESVWPKWNEKAKL